MACRLLLAAASSAVFSAPSAALVISRADDQSTCRNIPGDAQWPSMDDWSSLNNTVGGRLIATVPQASVCHDPTLDQSTCSTLQTPVDFHGHPPEFVTRLNLTLTAWDNAETYISKPAEMINAYYQNASCDPFTPSSKPCELGNRAVYSIDVTGADDVAAGMNFAREKNIRLTIKNTGHDYNGKSSGQGSLSLWTFNLKTADVMPNYQNSDYSGPAMKLGAGLGAGPALIAAGNAGYRIVTGECGTVGLTGGYTQGGGHSPLNSAYGLGADNVLEWEVVTGEGKHVVANPHENTDLYWALSGGGGGTYGVVLSMTVKLHPEGPIAHPLLTFGGEDTPTDTYWQGINIFHKHLATIVKGSRNSAQYNIWNDAFTGLFILFDGQSGAEINATMTPLLTELDSIKLKYNYTIAQNPTFLDYYNTTYGPLPYGYEPPSTLLDSRIIPRSIVQDDTARSTLMDAMKLTTNTGEFTFGCTALDASAVSHPDNAVLPAWRDAVSMCIMNAFWDWKAPMSRNYEVKDRMNNVYQAAMDAATPGGGVYLNEIDPGYAGDFKSNMYGANYGKLLDIKHAHDPGNLFYGHNAVGSDEFVVDGAGRLCYKGS